MMTHEQDPRGAFDRLSNLSVILIALCASPLLFLFTYLGAPGRGRAAAICGGLILMGAKMFWSLRRHALFWVALSIALCYHVPLILLISWGNRDYPGVVLLPLALPDFGIIFGLFKLAEKLTRTGPQTVNMNTGH